MRKLSSNGDSRHDSPFNLLLLNKINFYCPKIGVFKEDLRRESTIVMNSILFILLLF